MRDGTKPDLLNDSEFMAKVLARHPHKAEYPNSYDDGKHVCGEFIIFCDGGDWDISRCLRCGHERVIRCDFDDDYK